MPAAEVYTGFAPIDPAAEVRECAAVAAELGTRYEVVRYLNRGGFATVWEAFDRVEGIPVAVKRIDPNVARGRDFYREVRAMFRLDHPNVVRIINFLEAGGTRYLILELCGGGSLRAAISRGRNAGEACPPDRAGSLVGQVARGLAAAHKVGMAHRDIKPENVLFADRRDGHYGGGAGAKLADFGLAGVFYDESDGVLRQLTGSPAYMAPEQFTGSFAPASDVYALGVMTYELLTGDVPFRGSSEDLAYQHLRVEPHGLDALPDPWRGLVSRMLAKNPAARPPAAEVGERFPAAGTDPFAKSLTATLPPVPRSGRVAVTPRTPAAKPAGPATVVPLAGPAALVAARLTADGPEFLVARPDRVDRFGPAGELRGAIPLAGVTALAADAGGDFWLTAAGVVYRSAGGDAADEAGPVPAGEAVLVFSEGGRPCAVAADGESVAKYDLRTGEKVWATDVPAGGLKRRLARTPDGTILATDFAAGEPGLRSLGPDGASRSRLPLPGICWQAGWWAGGKRLYLRLLTGTGFGGYRSDSQGKLVPLPAADGVATLAAGPGGWLLGQWPDGSINAWGTDRRHRRLPADPWADELPRGLAAAGRVAAVLTGRGPDAVLRLRPLG